MIWSSSSADNIANRLRDFQHPDVNRNRTEVSVTPFGHKKTLLRVELYANDGTYIIDPWIVNGKERPGLLFTIDAISRSINILAIYLDREYQGRGIGTDFVTCLETAAINEKIREMALKPDDLTAAAAYWQNKHGFVFDPYKPSLMIKRLD
tara:strand:+ start:1809 stop:2261 length:453 start_codon:yes stop_codon:yes gene_type:complete